ncbi:hypothetical protein TI39_contig473g00005 [Zymoseptoria brevis]|uniref:Uncharacterized protein n=1 Tax=Zymoseptoria brevis TaxID=1047168 RepID=A0A0F4GJV2_9PEZI|nr:hypothetical protein TI39_contig473g00005 [Zymoseptoria brevis]
MAHVAMMADESSVSSDGRRKFCQAGNNCYAFDERPNDIFCCTDRSCTARVENGVTSTLSRAVPTTTTRQVAVTRTVYYTFIYTWYYYRYFFTIYQEVSVVTSKLPTTTTIFSVQATNSIDASSLAEGQIATITTSPAADASTQLASYTNRARSTAEETVPTNGVLNGDTDAQTASGTDVSSPTATLSSSSEPDVAVATGQRHMTSSNWIVMGAVLVGLAVM